MFKWNKSGYRISLCRAGTEPKWHVSVLLFRSAFYDMAKICVWKTKDLNYGGKGGGGAEKLGMALKL